MKKLTSDSHSPPPITLWSNFIKNHFFMKKPILCVNKSIFKKKHAKTDLEFGFPTLDYLWSNFIKNHFFMKKTYPLCKKINPKKNMKKLTSDSDSSTLKTFGWVLFQINYIKFRVIQLCCNLIGSLDRQTLCIFPRI